MATLPPELWIMIFDIVIEEGIVRSDQCDRDTFPYDYFSLSSGQDRYRFYGSYHRLRLVCRSFNALLGDRPYFELPTSSFPLPASIRALRIPAFEESNAPAFRQNLVDASRRERLVCLEVFCYISMSSNLPNISDLLQAGDERAFSNIQRLSVSFLGNRFLHVEFSFWTRLHQAFPQLVTLFMEVNEGSLYLDDNTEVTFETLEILHVAGGTGHIGYSNCRFPRLRHIFLGHCSTHKVETFKDSLQLEFLLIRSLNAEVNINPGSFSQLRVLSVPEFWLHKADLLDSKHPLEHLCLYLGNTSVIPRIIEEISEKLPGISRVTMDISSVDRDRRIRQAKLLQKMKLDSFGLAAQPIQYGGSILVVERVATTLRCNAVNDRAWKRVREKMWWW